MIRHTKAMRLAGGQIALALPDEVAATVKLDLSSGDKAAYATARSDGRDRRKRVHGGGCTGFTLEMAIARTRQLCQKSQVKRMALFADLEQRKRKPGGCRAVIFTEFTEVHAQIVVSSVFFLGHL